MAALPCNTNPVVATKNFAAGASYRFPIPEHAMSMSRIVHAGCLLTLSSSISKAHDAISK